MKIQVISEKLLISNLSNDTMLLMPLRTVYLSSAFRIANGYLKSVRKEDGFKWHLWFCDLEITEVIKNMVRNWLRITFEYPRNLFLAYDVGVK